MDKVSIERMRAGEEFQVRCRHRKGPGGKVASNTGWSGKESCVGKTQGSGWKIVRNEFRQVERLRGMKCFPGGETRFVGNMMARKKRNILFSYSTSFISHTCRKLI